MSATCPYCGAKLNLGLKFCVVCGRHISQDSIGRVGGGLRGGFRPADITRRLDELITVARFRRSRRSHEVERGVRFVFVNAIYFFVAVGLFYAAIQFSLEMVFPGQFKETRIPFNKIAGFFQEKTASISVPTVNKLPNSDKVVIIDTGRVTGGAGKVATRSRTSDTDRSSRKKKKKAKRKSRTKARKQAAKPASSR